MSITFTKMHGLGNDFVIVDAADLPSLAPEFLSKLSSTVCNRKFGVGADGLIVAAPPTDEEKYDIRFVYLNSDGTFAEMCGNGIRCFALYVRDRGMVSKNAFRVETLAGLMQPGILPDGQVRVDMGPPILSPERIPTRLDGEFPLKQAQLTVDGQTLVVTPVSMGNPHAILFQDEQPARLDPAVYGPKIELHPDFPAKTNVEFTDTVAPNHLKVVVWERGCGFTLACGTGACATAVAAILTGRASSEKSVLIDLPGGTLTIDWDGDIEHPVMMTGPASYVFSGSFNPVFLADVMPAMSSTVL
jgi:diaminopimelate epimerase